ncbi:TetR/AcrR family transcriptional regulator [Pseudonocardia bannensis]|uniref:TetR/AcrR family transcriptional regulator n=1 Tax=Pseudonocardia bannensis TaxID=630973 RepID=A0A848DNB4_9PSEU|nr:TetR/AcrR family transcriptional regulator [Pseudonocardia bannensis]NMH93976.1 TetR/AcrR family transcriptional regulator [Pseudonocardia bannensis]
MKQQRGEQTVRRLLDAALAVHAAHGSEGFTVHAVTAASGVSQGSLYHHFGSFDGLSAALYARCMGELMDALVGATTPARTARDGVHALVVAYLRFVADHTAAARFIHSTPWLTFAPPHAALVAAAKAPRVERLLEWVRPHVEAGRVVDLPAPLMEILVVGPPGEAARRWLAGSPDVDLEQAVALLPEQVWRSVKA